MMCNYAQGSHRRRRPLMGTGAARKRESPRTTERADAHVWGGRPPRAATSAEKGEDLPAGWKED